MPWIRHRLRDADVWAKVDNSGALVTDREGRVEIVYKPEAGAKVYRAGARNLTSPSGEPLEIAVGEAAAPSKPATTEPPPDAIHVWTDGACTGNPGPAGLGVVIIDGQSKERRELSEYLGEATNNIAELTAILRGLQEVRDRERPVIVYSDSQYSIGLLSKSWKAKANAELVAELRALLKKFRDVRFVKVLAHSGIALNERVDELARQAVERRI
jgi:ribonuclease HI